MIVDGLRKTAGPKRHRSSFLVVILLLVMVSSICLGLTEDNFQQLTGDCSLIFSPFPSFLENGWATYVGMVRLSDNPSLVALSSAPPALITFVSNCVWRRGNNT